MRLRLQLPGRLPISCGRRFEVRLPWHGGPVGGAQGPNGRIVVRLEGGSGFGLGDHPTTRGAAALLEEAVPTRLNTWGYCTVLDYGTGSGILAICAAFLGARQAVGVDVDVEAVAAAQRSLELNALPETISERDMGASDTDARITTTQPTSGDSRLGSFNGGIAASVGTLAPTAIQQLARRVVFRQVPEDFVAAAVASEDLVQEFGGFDIVVANIPHGVLVQLAPALAAASKPGALLALTGLRRCGSECKAVRSAYDLFFECFEEVALEDGWVLLRSRRRLETT
eukprot:TRINITY_DN50547_c0_g1_i1.p1 TRINITY_DN50547_c0_g1~~TRINITY_DN50547_c0_g1_i1.p1  ORF type:complete len:284 (-),score=59.18 TRINITY_DN50547_c0_g1_i1:374-1225(-)